MTCSTCGLNAATNEAKTCMPPCQSRRKLHLFALCMPPLAAFPFRRSYGHSTQDICILSRDLQPGFYKCRSQRSSGSASPRIRIDSRTSCLASSCIAIRLTRISAYGIRQNSICIWHVWFRPHRAFPHPIYYWTTISIYSNNGRIYSCRNYDI